MSARCNRGLALLIALTLLGGCAPSRSLKPSMTTELANNLDQPFRVQVAPGSERLVGGEQAHDGSAAVQSGLGTATSIDMAARNAAANGMAGNGSGAGVAAGVVLGSLIVAQMNQNAVQGKAKAEADKRVAGLREAIAAQNLEGWYGNAFADAFANAGRPSNPSAALTLDIAPQALLSQDLHSVRVISEVRLMLGRSALYQGRIEVHSAPLACEDCLADWAAEQGKPYQAALRAGVDETVRVLLLDWKTRHFASSNNPERTLSYQLGDSRYVERGRLVDSQAGRSLYLSLRGWVKSVPVAIAP
ncbi:MULTISPECIES: hypothetical protein [Pseudomonas]|uniref:hypothetical protein n=1 Tax=Pseudomonas TaxID=286 RepID=UPI00249B56CC|nr:MULTISPECIES: hypothetical protein [Pseudomonas]